MSFSFLEIFSWLLFWFFFVKYQHAHEIENFFVYSYIWIGWYIFLFFKFIHLVPLFLKSNWFRLVSGVFFFWWFDFDVSRLFFHSFWMFHFLDIESLNILSILLNIFDFFYTSWWSHPTYNCFSSFCIGRLFHKIWFLFYFDFSFF
jgi:hypothetical protein